MVGFKSGLRVGRGFPRETVTFGQFEALLKK